MATFENKLLSESNFGVALLDRITKSVLRLPNANADLKPEQLKENFGVALYELHMLKSALQKRAFHLEAKCRENELDFRVTVEKLRTELSSLHDQFVKLDTQVHMVTGKLTHLGDQLERKSLPRKRIEEASELILEFYKFLGAGGGSLANVAANWQDDEAQLLEAATRIKSLSSLCLELPDDERFLSAKQRVTVTHQQLENKLLERFRMHCANRSVDMMKRIADVLINSKSHSTCTAIFIEEVLKVLRGRKLDFSEIKKILVPAEQAIISIFPRPENVLLQLLTSLIADIIKPHVTERIQRESRADIFVTNLYVEYQNMEKFMKILTEELTLITDPSQLSKLFRDLFGGYLSEYMNHEQDWLSRHLTRLSNQFYETCGHQKRALNTSGLADLKRDLRAMLHIQPDVRRQMDYESSLLSVEMSVEMIADIRQAASRCLLLSQPSDFGQNGTTLFNILHRFLILEHVDYGVTLALQGLQLVDVRSMSPKVVFFSVVRDASSIFHFFEQSLDASILPLVSTSTKHSQDLANKRQSIKQDMEAKLQLGLERTLNLAISHMSHILMTEQRKTDYRPDLLTDTDSIPSVDGPPSQACHHVTTFLDQLIHEAQEYLDGQNLNNFLSELGLRVNRTLVDHFYTFTFSDAGGFVAMQDVIAYRETIKQTHNPVVVCLFDVLVNLMNLMIIKPENVPQVAQDYLQSGIPREVLQNFIQLRADYKTAKSVMEIRTKGQR